MSEIRKDGTDRELHYSDGAHRWTCPDPAVSQDGWERRMRAHIADHLMTPPRDSTPKDER